ncbi:MAG: transcription termination factor NusA [Verrucomicrobiota bacterium]|jgi:N utilization substance protein A|nr:transcription termination factor NusA [Verrucomicrobiota bacterium]MDP6251199.1 transcription termination factor NusA [Verrucomicrobiota bacterium]MDP7177622.1 transcription termination factor NusA [Verrucomicrobiota bacterium]MDP7292942.1 transcription termination factor NusA [Verrucomicrobiota bacterium]MDP7441540.1 transcription termination factor NusA [Verrucomicrobiota bacterium]|tara:strand:- start:90 stop:1460 length:1371 start_codon:yes stop_codon:yes gene_type:complete
MNAEFIASMEYWEREKGLDREILISAVEDAMVSAAKRAVGPARELRCEIDRKDGDIRAFASLIVVETVTDKQSEISLDSAKRHKPSAQLDEELEVEVTPKNFGRIASQNAKQALMQAIRRAEKALIYSEFKDRVGEIVSGEVRGFDRSDVLVDLGKFEALLPNRERVPTEEYQRGERIRCLVKAVQGTDSNSEIILSRRDSDFVLKLFQLEVSEINDGTIEVKAIAREPGFRTKLAVHSRDEKVDPVGACVGLRGQRVKNIVRELNNEKIDIIRWDADIETYVTNSLAPAQLKRLEIEQDKKRAHILVDPDQLSLTIGRRGQNARLTSILTGWQIDIDPEEEVRVGFEEQVAGAVEALAAIPGIEKEQADALVHAGLLTLDALIGVEAGDLADIPGLADHAESVQAAAHAEKERRAGSSANPLTEEAPPEAAAESEEDTAPETETAEEAAPTKEAE